jgi:hypothetical protein
LSFPDAQVSAINRAIAVRVSRQWPGSLRAAFVQNSANKIIVFDQRPARHQESLELLHRRPNGAEPRATAAIF